MVRYFHARLAEIMKYGIDLLCCNEDEAMLFSQTSNVLMACQKLRLVADTFLVTQGPRGSIVYDGNRFYDIAAHDVPVVDTVGAGDMYAGGFIFAITHGYDYETAGIIADIVASKVISKFGPRLNDQEVEEVKIEVADFLEEQNHCDFSQELVLVGEAG